MIVVVLPVDEADIVVEGSMKKPCSRCQRECWVAPSVQKALPNGEVVCFHCVADVFAERINMLHQSMRL